MEKLTDGLCPVCGFKARSEDAEVLLKSRYSLGSVFCETLDSIVYIAYDNELNKKVFVREFVGENIIKLCENEQTDILNGRFLNTAKATAGISLCDLLPRTIDTFCENNKAFWVTDYFEGQSLKTLLKSGVKISPASALNIAALLLKGVRHIHSSGSVFGNISPETVYILKNNSVRLFGISSPFYDFTEDTNARAEFLNPSYAAPELFINTEKITAACDVYSVAAILYRIITKKIPPISFLRVGGDTVFSLKADNSAINKETATAILNAFNWHTKKRTPSPDAFLKELSEKSVKRMLSGRIFFANILGFWQNLFDSLLLKLKSEKKPSKPKTHNKNKTKRSMLWLIITLPALLLVALIICLILLLPKNSANVEGNLSSSNQSEDEWYYGNGSETSKTESNYSYGGYSSKNQSSSQKTSSVVSDTLGPNLIECPDFTGYFTHQLSAILEDNNLLLGEIIYEYSAVAPVDSIISQSVKSGEIIKKGSRIDLVVSAGKAKLPEISGLELHKAIDALKNSGFKNFELSFTASDNAIGTVLEANFESEAEADLNGKILITVSGEEATVLDYQDKTVAEIKALSSDFSFEFVLQNGEALPENADFGTYTVVAQSYEKNKRAYKGMTITLTAVSFED